MPATRHAVFRERECPRSRFSPRTEQILPPPRLASERGGKGAEILTAIFAWRGNALARVMGILYGLVFGIGSLLAALGGLRSEADGAAGGAAVLLAFAIGYLYVLGAFTVSWRRRA